MVEGGTFLAGTGEKVFLFDDIFVIFQKGHYVSVVFQLENIEYWYRFHPDLIR